MRNVMTKAWEIAREGQKKFGGKVKEYLAEALRMAWAIVRKGVNKMVELKGSEKQIKWANDVREQAIEKIGAVIKELEEWGNEKRVRARYYKRYVEIFEEMKNNDSAAFWIDLFGYQKFYIDFISAFDRHCVNVEGSDAIVQKMFQAFRTAQKFDTK